MSLEEDLAVQEVEGADDALVDKGGKAYKGPPRSKHMGAEADLLFAPVYDGCEGACPVPGR